jgi:Tc toxin complex TcA C-terminal TcB-binding domain
MPIVRTGATVNINDDILTPTGGIEPRLMLENIYTFYNYFHPFVSELLEQLNKKSIDGLLDVNFHQELNEKAANKNFFKNTHDLNQEIEVKGFPKEIDVSENGAYAAYNWELFFHVPLTIAVHLSKNQRFAEAQRWFHYIFDPTSNDEGGEAPWRFWKFLRFRRKEDVKQIDELLRIFSEPGGEDAELKECILGGYEDIRKNPFQPHLVARTRHLAYQYCVVMKYLDNLIAWGDSLFRQDTIETINEATQLYVLAANLLGPRPQRIPPPGRVRPKTFRQLRNEGLDKLGNALVALEAEFPFNLYLPHTEGVDTDAVNPLFGIGRTLYFCIPHNDKLLSYWDTVADRLFKIRHCMNIEGVVRQLPLFEPPIDPGMLVKAAAAGIDISSMVSGLNQPLAPVRSALLIQKALEICGEVRGLGASLLSAIEKSDGEALSLLRQRHEINIQQLAQDVRYLQWKDAEEATESLLKSLASTLERYKHYQRLLGKKEEDLAELESLVLERRELTEDNFDEVYGELVGQYDSELELEAYPPLVIKGASNPSNQSGANGQGHLYLNTGEDADLNIRMPLAHKKQEDAISKDELYGYLGLLPNLGVDFEFWGIGGHLEFGGPALAAVGRILAGKDRAEADKESYRGTRASKTASYERRTEDWILQNNLAARELMQMGRQIISSLIREQITRREYDNLKTQIEQAREVDRFLREKFTNQELYGWMQGELSKLYYEYYKFAFDIARQAERTMKHELMRPELDSMSFIKFNYWDGGRKGLLCGETLHLDLKRMEMAYHEHNKREYELTKHVSLRQLDPLALLTLKATGACEMTIPEALFDLDCPGHYMRRIKSVSLSIPAVTGPYTSINCTLSLLRSSLRRSPLLQGDQYERDSSEDGRFVDYFGAIQSVVTSNAGNDSGLFETNLRDERFLPFEGAGACSAWRLELPAVFRQFDYDTIADVILHLRYTAREGGSSLRNAAVTDLETRIQALGSVRLFSVRHEFPAEWAKFKNLQLETAPPFGELTFTLREEHYPFWSRERHNVVNGVEIFARTDQDIVQVADNANGDSAERLVKDASLAGLCAGKLTNIRPLPAPVGKFTLYLNDNTMEELLVAVTWG